MAIGSDSPKTAPSNNGSVNTVINRNNTVKNGAKVSTQIRTTDRNATNTVEIQENTVSFTGDIFISILFCTKIFAFFCIYFIIVGCQYVLMLRKKTISAIIVFSAGTRI